MSDIREMIADEQGVNLYDETLEDFVVCEDCDCKDKCLQYKNRTEV